MYNNTNYVPIVYILQQLIKQFIHTSFEVCDRICGVGGGRRVKTDILLRTPRVKSSIFHRLFLSYFSVSCDIFHRFLTASQTSLTVASLLLRTEWKFWYLQTLII